MNLGIVLKSTGSNYIVKSENDIFICKIRGKFRIEGIKATNPVAVGDIVEFDILDKKTGIIKNIQERKNYIIRKSTNLSKQSHIIAANIDQALLIATMILPETPLEFIDRFLITAEIYKIPAKIIFNKLDIYTGELIEYMYEVAKIYQDAGYDCFAVSATKRTNIEQIEELLKGRISLLAGNSGVGKTTLINAIDPDLNLKTDAISLSHLTGKHTTTFAEMFELKTGGYIIDTPGIKSFGIVDMNKEDIAHNFPEMFDLLGKCKYYNCTHIHEPECAVKDAVEKGLIAWSRYRSYISLMEGEDSKYREDIYKE